MSADPIHILTHEFHPRRGGIATVTEEMARAAASLGSPVEVWAPAGPPGTAEPAWPFPVHRLRQRGTHDFRCVLETARTLVRERRRLRHAIVWLAEPGPMLAMMSLQWIPAFRPRRLVLTFHGSEILRFHRDPLTRWLTRRLIGHAVRIGTLTRYTRDLLCRHFPAAADKVCLTPGAVSSIPDPRPAAGAAAPHDKVRILTVGRLHPRKGQLQTLSALAALPPAVRARIEYWIVGRDPRGRYEAELRRAAATADFPVRFLGDLDDQAVEEAYAAADIFAMTSIEHRLSVEGFGLVYLEAAAHGLPVVAHDVGGVSEAVRPDETGLLVAPDEPGALTAAFARLIADPALRQRLGAAGRAWARRHDWRDSARILFDLPANES